MSDNRFLPAGVRRSRFFFLRVTGLGTALLFAVALGESPSSAVMACLSRSLSLFSSATILPVSKMPPLVCCPFADCESVSADALDEQAGDHLTSGLVLRLLASVREEWIGCHSDLGCPRTRSEHRNYFSCGD